MSRVFVARDNALARDVVVKVLSPELAQELSAERFAREVRLAAGLQEPHIVPVLAAGATVDGLPYYTMPFVAGESLRARMSLGLAGAVEWFDGNFAASIEPMAKCLELSPESTLWRWQWGYALALNGRVAEAAAQAEWLWRSDPANAYSRQLMVMTHALRGDIAEARRAMVPFDGAHFDPHMTFHVAECHVLTGDHARGIELVESAVARGFYPYAFIAQHDPFLEAVRTDPALQRCCAGSEAALAGARRLSWKKRQNVLPGREASTI